MTNKLKLKLRPFYSVAVIVLVTLTAAGAASASSGTASSSGAVSFVEALVPEASEVAQSSCSGTPTISTFSVNPSTIEAGQNATLSWGFVYNAQAVYLMANGQKTGVATPGQMTVYPDQTTTYTLEAVCGDVRVQTHVTLSVTAGGACTGTPQITSFTANPIKIQPGQTSTLSWGQVMNAQKAALLSPEGKQGVGTPGQLVVEPSRTTTYVLSGYCGDQVAKRYVTVVVEGASNCSGTPQITSFFANPSVIQRGQTTKLEWGQVMNASGAYLSTPDGIRGVGTPGSSTEQPQASTTYYLYAICGDVIIRQQATVTVY
jgi:hypothetical protein